MRELRDLPAGEPVLSVSARLKSAVHGLAARTQAGRRAGARAAAVDVLAAGEVLAPLAGRCGADFDRFLTAAGAGPNAG